MRLVACAECRAQFDVTGVGEERFRCHCGAWVENRPPAAADAEVRRCSACGALLEEKADACAYCGAAVVRDEKLRDLICPYCCARNEESARYCASCGSAFHPLLVVPPGETHACPGCGKGMAARGIGGIRVEECPACGGTWAPGESLDRLVERALAMRNQRVAATGAAPVRRGRHRTGFQSRVVYRRCPECNAVMQRRNFARTSGIIVDWCSSHGTWLDAEELEAVAAFALDGGLEGGTAGAWKLPASEERARAVAESERLLAAGRGATPGGAGTDLLRALGEILGGWRI